MLSSLIFMNVVVSFSHRDLIGVMIHRKSACDWLRAALWLGYCMLLQDLNIAAITIFSAVLFMAYDECMKLMDTWLLIKRQSFPSATFNSVWSSIVGSPIWSKVHLFFIKLKSFLLKCMELAVFILKGIIKRVDWTRVASLFKRADKTSAAVVLFNVCLAFKNFDVSSLMGFLFRLMLGVALAFLIHMHVTGSYLPTTEDDLSGHRDDHVKKPWKEPTSKFKQGQYVYYRHSKQTFRAKILRVHFDDDLDPFYDVKLGDAREKQTTEDHLSDELGSGHFQVFIDIFDDDPECDLY